MRIASAGLEIAAAMGSFDAFIIVRNGDSRARWNLGKAELEALADGGASAPADEAVGPADPPEVEAQKLERLGPWNWLMALVGALAIGTIAERLGSFLPAFSSFSVVAQTGAFGAAIWALTTAHETKLANDLVRLLLKWKVLVPLLVLALVSVVWNVLWVRCDQRGDLGEPGNRNKKVCQQGDTIVFSRFGITPLVTVVDSRGLQVARSLLPVQTNTLAYPSDFSRKFHVLVALSDKSLQQVPEEEWQRSVSVAPCNARFCVRVGGNDYNLPPGGLVLGAETADDTLLIERIKPPGRDLPMPGPVSLPNMVVEHGRELELELFRREGASRISCGISKFEPSRGWQLWRISSERCQKSSQ